MQNRRIIDQMLRSAGARQETALETDSVVALLAHVATGRWSSIVPSGLTEAIGLTAGIRAIPIVQPEVSHLIGLVVSQRYAISPIINALVQEAERLAVRQMPRNRV